MEQQTQQPQQSPPPPAPQQSNNTLMWVLGGLVVILLIAVGILAMMAFSKPETPPPPPPPENVVPTLPPEQEQPTAPPAPTQGPPPTPIPGDPAVELGSPDGRDDFSTDNNWTGFENQCFKSEIADGQFVMTAKGKAGFSCWEVSWPAVQNYYLETNVIMPETCQPDDRFGLFIRTPDLESGYLVGLTCDGRVSMTNWTGSDTVVLMDFTTSDAVNVGPGAVNRLGVIANGSTYQVYVNGALIGQAADASYVGNYRFGYFVRAASEEPFTVRFDDMAIWLLDQ